MPVTAKAEAEAEGARASLQRGRDAAVGAAMAFEATGRPARSRRRCRSLRTVALQALLLQ
jgi:hypothetical protein